MVTIETQSSKCKTQNGNNETQNSKCKTQNGKLKFLILL